MMTLSHSAMGVSDCPHMKDTQSLCPFNFTFYLGIWKSLFTFLPNIKLILFFSVFIFVIMFFIDLIFFNKLFFNRKRIRTKIKILYQELFSNGLLNPKVF